MQKFKQILGIIFLTIFVGFMGNKFISENWNTPGGDIKIFMVIVVLIMVILAVIRILKY